MLSTLQKDLESIWEFKDPLERMTRTFDALVDFLRSSEQFPNRTINELVTLMWKLIGNKDIPLALDQWGVATLSIMVFSDNGTLIPIFVLPRRFISLVRENLFMQLEAVVYNASQGRDYYTKQITGNNKSIIDTRAIGYDSEALLTLQKMAEKEGFPYKLNSYQESILRQFPNGLNSLSKDLKYDTPPYINKN